MLRLIIIKRLESFIATTCCLFVKMYLNIDVVKVEDMLDVIE